VNNKKPDIEQIRKYLNGELDASAMHQLERQAQHDPFLMDALEGFERTNTDQQANLHELNQRLTERIKQDHKKVIPLMPLSIAASVIIIIALGLLFWHSNQNSSVQVKVPLVVQEPLHKPKPIVRDTISTSLPAGSESLANQKIYSFNKAPEKLKTKSFKSPNPVVELDEPVTGVTEKQTNADPPTSKKLDLNMAYASANASDSAYSKMYNKGVQLQGRVNGVQVTTPEGLRGTVTDINGLPLAGANVKVSGTNISALTNNYGNFTLPPAALNRNLSVGYMGYESQTLKTGNTDSVHITLKPSGSQLAEVSVTGYTAQLKKDVTGIPPATNQLERKVIKGVVTDESGEPVPGALVKIKGTTNSTLTDAHGKFALPAQKDKSILDIAFVGYQSKEITAGIEDSVRVKLNTNNSALSEVVVTGYNSNNNEQHSVSAHPAKGWHTFNKYLKANAVSPDGKKGKVKVSFTVEANGGLSNFKVIKSLSEQADAKAIELIKNGDSWVGDTDHTPHTITVKVIFH